MIGLGGWGNRNEKTGPYVYLNDEGKTIRDKHTDEAVLMVRNMNSKLSSEMWIIQLPRTTAGMDAHSR